MGMFSGAPIFEEMTTINVKSLKDWGYLDNGARKSGTITWSRRGEVTGSIDIASAILSGKGLLFLSYNSGGEAFKYAIQLITRESNLGIGFYWLFICPATGRACRKLYLYNRRFVSRHAIRSGLYERQTWSRYGRLLAAVFEESEPPRRLKRYYRGKITPRFSRLMRKRDRQRFAAFSVGGVEGALRKGKR